MTTEATAMNETDETYLERVAAGAVIHRDGPFQLTRTTLIVRGNPTIDEWLEFGEWLRILHDGVQWWWGDWLSYGRSKPGWEERWTQALMASGVEESTLSNYAYVAENVHPSRRRDASEGVTYSHHAAVASLPPKEQSRILAKVADEQLTVRQTAAAVAEAKGKPVKLWLEVACVDEADRAALAQRMINEGRDVMHRL
jgi:hypothetical protein